ncbi:MAG: hypothetical protein EKK49_13265 [Rhodocyclaceae bacterium]|nr:MAG: hypothetical protein EKK49_13265 [Rhodocyclaceae bacterium]
MSSYGAWSFIMRRALARLFAVMAGVLPSLHAHAEDSAFQSVASAVEFKGFGTLGVARSDSNDAEFVRDLSQPRGITKHWTSRNDSVVGLQMNAHLGPQTEGVLQVISRYRPEGTHTPEVSWAFLRHEFSPDLQVRVGRLAPEIYMLADSRLVGYSNIAIRPPADFYGSLVFAYFDGADVMVSSAVGDGVLRGKLYGGRSPERTGFYDPVTWDIRGSRLFGGYLDYLKGPWQFRVTHMEVKFSASELPLNYLANLWIGSIPALAPFRSIAPVDITGQLPELSTVNTRSRFDSIGVVYDKGALQLQGMIGRIKHQTESYEDSRAGFVLGAYRIGVLTPYMGYSWVRSSPGNVTTVPAGPFGPALNAFGKQIVAATHLDQHTATLGIRWDFRPNWALKFQADAIRGSTNSTFLFRGPNVQWDGRMNVFSAALDFAY